MLINMDSGRVLYEKNADKPIPPASLAKVMTMFLTLDAVKAGKLNLNRKIKIVREAAAAGGSTMRLKTGEYVPAVRLLAGAAVASGNDAATALALHLAGSQKKFAAQMNAKAKKLGLRNTVFKNPTGLPATGQKTTARDMITLCRTYLKAHPQANRFHAMKFFMHKGLVIRNTNLLLGRVAGVNGVKTGWTVASGYNLLVTAKRGKTKLMAVVMGGRTKNARDAFATRLLEAGFKNPANPQAVKKEIDGVRTAKKSAATTKNGGKIRRAR